MENFCPLNNDYVLEDSSVLFYPMAQMLMRTIQTSSFVDMLICSDEVQPSHSIVLYRFSTTAANGGKHPPGCNTTAHYASISSLENPHFVQQNQNTGTMAVDQAKFSPCIGRRNFRNK